MSHTITIGHDLVIFPADTRTLNGKRKEIPAGTYKVEEATQAGKVHWWKLVGENWGNATVCWEAVMDTTGNVSPVQKIENFSKKIILAMIAAFLGCVLIQNQWPVVPSPPQVHEPTSVLSGALQQYTFGRIQAIHPLPRPDAYYLSEYRAGWYTILEILTGRRPWTHLNHPLIAQIHRDALIALLLVSIFIRIPVIARKSLMLFLPALLLPLLPSPSVNPELDRSLAFFYPAVAGAVIALLWANPEKEETQDGKTILRNYFARLVAVSYNVVIFLMIFGRPV